MQIVPFMSYVPGSEHMASWGHVGCLFIAGWLAAAAGRGLVLCSFALDVAMHRLQLTTAPLSLNASVVFSECMSSFPGTLCLFLCSQPQVLGSKLETAGTGKVVKVCTWCAAHQTPVSASVRKVVVTVYFVLHSWDGLRS